MLLITLVTSADLHPLPRIISLAADATISETSAANLLHTTLALAQFTTIISQPPPPPTTSQIAVGYGAAVAFGIAPARLTTLGGNDSFVLQAGLHGIAAAATATSRRGTMNAVSRLLRESGFQFIAPDETILPSTLPPVVNTSAPGLNLDFVPGFEYRDCNSWPVRVRTTSATENAQWAATLGYNGPSANGGSRRGGYVEYASPPGFVHTSYNLLAGAENGFERSNDHCNNSGRGPCRNSYWIENPAWFWPQTKNRTADLEVAGQLCWTAPGLIEYLTESVRKILRMKPNASIISVSQNDNGDYCTSPGDAKVIADEGGSPQAPMLRAVNAIADAIAEEFPNVAIDTLAYQYTRKAPSITKPRPNVIVRLCSIECNFALPLTSPSNAKFASDMDAWAAISNRTYIWNYVTNFGNYISPFPDWQVVGVNLKYFHAHGVKGVFEEGTYTSPGGNMETLKSACVYTLRLSLSLSLSLPRTLSHASSRSLSLSFARSLSSRHLFCGFLFISRQVTSWDACLWTRQTSTHNLSSRTSSSATTVKTLRRTSVFIWTFSRAP